MRLKFLMVFGGILLVLVFLVSSISTSSSKRQTGRKKELYQVEVQKYVWFDSTRGREVPLAIYFPRTLPMDSVEIPIVLFSHGYGSNYPHNYNNYTYLTEKLASYGYWVISVQHELSNDPLLPQTGDVQVVRRPFWNRGMENLIFTLNTFKRNYSNVKIKSIDAVGHSNGGDIAVYTAKNHPDLFRKVITLDHLRVAIPENSATTFYTLRSNDKQPDSLVLPKSMDPKHIVWLKKIGHNDMNDEGTRRQHKTINAQVIRFIQP